MVATKLVAVVSQREPQKSSGSGPVRRILTIRVFSRLIGQPESSFEQPLDPIDQLPGLIACQDHEVIGIPHQLGVGPRTGTVATAVNCFSNQCR